MAAQLGGGVERVPLEDQVDDRPVEPSMRQPPTGTAVPDAQLTVGPGFLRTDIGEAVGIDVGAWVESEIPLTGNLSLMAGLGVNGFFAENVQMWGPALTLGINVAW